MTITIYHNPSCSKSRKTLEIIEEKGVTPRIVRYLEDTPDAATLQRLAELLGVPLREILRTGETDYADAADSLPLDNDVALAKWLHEHPRVLQRPIVVNESSGAAVIGRPPENVVDIL